MNTFLFIVAVIVILLLAIQYMAFRFIFTFVSMRPSTSASLQNYQKSKRGRIFLTIYDITGTLTAFGLLYVLFSGLFEINFIISMIVTSICTVPLWVFLLCVTWIPQFRFRVTSKFKYPNISEKTLNRILVALVFSLPAIVIAILVAIIIFYHR